MPWALAIVRTLQWVAAGGFGVTQGRFVGFGADRVAGDLGDGLNGEGVQLDPNGAENTLEELERPPHGLPGLHGAPGERHSNGTIIRSPHLLRIP